MAVSQCVDSIRNIFGEGTVHMQLLCQVVHRFANFWRSCKEASCLDGVSTVELEIGECWL